MEWKFITSSQPEIKEGRNSQPSRRTETKSTSKREITCYKCGQIGHISRNSPKKSFGQGMSYQDQLRKGIVNGIPTDRIVLDTGASTTIVHQRMVTEENYTGCAKRTVHKIMTDGSGPIRQQPYQIPPALKKDL